MYMYIHVYTVHVHLSNCLMMQICVLVSPYPNRNLYGGCNAKHYALVNVSASVSCSLWLVKLCDGNPESMRICT